MKKILLAAVLVAVISLSGCTKSKEAQCEAAIDKMMNLTLNSPEMKKMKGMMDQIKKQMKEKKKENVAKCVEEFDADLMSCINGISTIEEMKNCKPKKKSKKK